MKFTCSCAPDVEFTLDALRLVEPAVKPVPETDTDVADVSPVPFTTIVCWLVVLAVQVPKSTVLPFVGDVMPEVVVVPPEMVALRFTLVETEPLVMVSVPV